MCNPASDGLLEALAREGGRVADAIARLEERQQEIGAILAGLRALQLALLVEADTLNRQCHRS